MILEIELPSDEYKEKLILGGCMSDAELLHAARPIMTAEDFTLDTHRCIWSRMCDVYDCGLVSEVGVVDVWTALKAKGESEKCGNLSGLNELVYLSSGMIGESLVRYMRDVQDKTARRRIMFTAEKAINDCSQHAISTQEISDSLAAASSVSQQAGSRVTLESAGEFIGRVGMSEILKPRRYRGLQFPWPWMNKHTNGMLPAELWVLAAHTSGGKTTAMFQHLVSAAIRGHSVALFSLEMSSAELYLKAANLIGGIDSTEASAGSLTKEQSKAQAAALSMVSELPIYIETQCMTVSSIHAAVRRLRSRKKIDHIIIDYLQLVETAGRQENRAQQVGAIARAMKMLAVEFQVPVLLLSQLSRQSNKPGQEREPDLTDLKESGDIENHANGVWFIHKPKCPDADCIPVKFMIAKQRAGRRNIEKNFYFFPAMQKFGEAE